MRHSIATACFVIGSILAPVAAYATDANMDRGHPSTFAKDSVVTTKIKAAMAAEHLKSLKNISVDTDAGGVVRLSGTVDSPEEAKRAITIARNTDGVKSVSSDLRVQKDD